MDMQHSLMQWQRHGVGTLPCIEAVAHESAHAVIVQLLLLLLLAPENGGVGTSCVRTVNNTGEKREKAVVCAPARLCTMQAKSFTRKRILGAVGPQTRGRALPVGRTWGMGWGRRRQFKWDRPTQPATWRADNLLP